MKIFISALLLIFFAEAFSQDESKAIEENASVVHVIVLREHKPEDHRLAIDWRGFYIGLEIENRFADNHTMKFEVKPSMSSYFGISEKYLAGFHLIIPTEKNNPLRFDLSIHRKIF